MAVRKYETPMGLKTFISGIEDEKERCVTIEAMRNCDRIIEYASAMHDDRKIRNALASSAIRHIKTADELVNAIASVLF